VLGVPPQFCNGSQLVQSSGLGDEQPASGCGPLSGVHDPSERVTVVPLPAAAAMPWNGVTTCGATTCALGAPLVMASGPASSPMTAIDESVAERGRRPPVCRQRFQCLSSQWHRWLVLRQTRIGSNHLRPCVPAVRRTRRSYGNEASH
jgi:hypothetical protein